jgi:hypothetical protein
MAKVGAQPLRHFTSTDAELERILYTGAAGKSHRAQEIIGADGTLSPLLGPGLRW